jgi:endonuclease III
MSQPTNNAAAGPLEKLQKKLLTSHPAPSRPSAIDPRRALVAGILAANCPDEKVAAALATFDAEFVDFNELRVAGELEIQDLLGRTYPAAAERAERLHHVLHGVFQREAGFVMEQWQTLGKKDQRQYLRDLPGMTPFVEAYVMLHATSSAALPIDEQTLSVLIDAAAVPADADPAAAQKQLEAHLKADDHWPLYTALRAESQSSDKHALRKPARKKAG